MVNTGGKLPRIYYFRDFRSPDQEETTEVSIKQLIYFLSAATSPLVGGLQDILGTFPKVDTAVF